MSCVRAVFAIATSFALVVLATTRVRAEELPPYRAGLSLQHVSSGFDLTAKPSGPGAPKLSYRPAQSQYLGIILGHGWLGGTISFSVPPSREIRDEEGSSRYSDYRLNYYSRRMGVELAYNRFTGYVIDNSSSLSDATRGGAKYYRLPDLSTEGFGGNYIWVHSPEKYSLPAAIEHSEIQKESAGSLLFLATFREQRASNPTSIIPTEKRADFGSDATIRGIRAFSLAPGVGYGFNLVPSVFYVSLLAAASLGYQNIRYDLDAGSTSRSSPAVNLHARIGLGINARHFFLAGSFALDRYTLATEAIEVGQQVSMVMLAVGARF